MKNPLESTIKPPLVVSLLFGVFAVLLCWNGISWALRPGLFMAADELGNLNRFLAVTVWHSINLLPHAMYNDRPTGFALEQLLFKLFGFDYYRQLICFLAIHFTNCGFGFVLMRRMGVSIPLAIAGIGVFGTLWTTAETATYLGAVFDVLGLFFLLGSTLAFLSEKRGAKLLSACLFVLALRTKEFTIVAPAVFAVFAVFSAPEASLGQKVVWTARRLWMHLVILGIFASVYLSLIPAMRLLAPPNSPYHMQFDVPTILGSFSYYTALIVGQDETVLAHLPCVFGLVFGAVLAYGAFRRDAALLFSMAAYILTLLPVSMLPNQRATFYAYAPQMFLILLVCVLSERAIALLPKRATLQWAAAVGVALAMMSWALSFRRSDYFGNRMTFYLNMRMESATSAAAALTLLPEIAKGAHLYVNHGDRNPWLFVSCAYFQLRQKDMTVTCVTHQPEATLRTLYAADRGPKYLLDYKEGGALTVEDVSPSAR